MDPGGGSSPASVGRGAVTRSATRSRAIGIAGASGQGRGQPKSRKRLYEKLKQKKPTDSSNVWASSTGGGDGCKTGEPLDFCPLKFHGCSSSDAVQEVISTFDSRKLSILDKVGLGGLQYLKLGFHNSRHLVFWMLKRTDVHSMTVKLGDGSCVSMSIGSVARILGIRCIGREIVTSSSKASEYVKCRLRERFGTDDSKEYPDLDDLRKVLYRQYGDDMSAHDEETFMIAIAGLCCAYLFGPPNRTAEVPRDIWQFIAYPNKLLDCNWGGYVPAVLQNCARTVQLNMRNNPNSIKLGGCWLYLQVRMF